MRAPLTSPDTLRAAATRLLECEREHLDRHSPAPDATLLGDAALWDGWHSPAEVRQRRHGANMPYQGPVWSL